MPLKGCGRWHGESCIGHRTQLSGTDDDIETVVTSIQALAMTLRTIADEGKGVVLGVVVELGKGPVAALIDDLVRARKVESLEGARGVLWNVSGIKNECLGKFT